MTAEARRPHWYVEGEVPDTLDGRFLVLATVTALALVRLEADVPEGNPLSVALTERFVEVMESEHRELGLGDPGLGKTVRKLVGMLGRRTQIWRMAAAGQIDWDEATRTSLYPENVDALALRSSAESLDGLRRRLAQAPLPQLHRGDIK